MIIDWVLSWEQTQLDQDIIGTIASWNTDPASDKAAESVLRFPGAVLNRDGAVDTHTSVWGRVPHLREQVCGFQAALPLLHGSSALLATRMARIRTGGYTFGI